MDTLTTLISTRTLTRMAVKSTGTLTPLVLFMTLHVLSLARHGTVPGFVST